MTEPVGDRGATSTAPEDLFADLFTQVSRELDKSLWFLEAHLQQG